MCQAICSRVRWLWQADGLAVPAFEQLHSLLLEPKACTSSHLGTS